MLGIYAGSLILAMKFDYFICRMNSSVIFIEGAHIKCSAEGISLIHFLSNISRN